VQSCFACQQSGWTGLGRCTPRGNDDIDILKVYRQGNGVFDREMNWGISNWMKSKSSVVIDN
jgi:hypothetical protein